MIDDQNMPAASHGTMHTRTTRSDFARALLDANPGRITFGDLADLIAHGADESIPERAITIARDRLKAAADRGNVKAGQLLAGLPR